MRIPGIQKGADQKIERPLGMLKNLSIVLGSSSSSRRAVLETLGVGRVLVVHPDIDEHLIGDRQGDPGSYMSF